MKKCLHFTKELSQKMCSHFPYFSYLNLKYVQCFIFYYLVYVRILSLHFSEELKMESEARNCIIIARITLSEHVGVHVCIHCLRL